jgi:hypothetical protein
MNDSPAFSSSKSRSKHPIPKVNFEAKFYIEKCKSRTLLIGITDNPSYEVDSATFIDNIWVFKPSTGEKYSSKQGSEKYINCISKEQDFLYVIKIQNDVYFKLNYEEAPIAFTLGKYQDYYFYIENDSPFEHTKIVFIYLRKI